MSDIRIPVSLKVDDSSDMYFSLIEPLRANRDLSGFIMIMFQLYLDNEEFKKIVDNRIMGFDTKEKIEKHLQAIAQTHGDNVRAVEDFEEDVLNSSTLNGSDLGARLSALEQSVQNLVQGLQNSNNMLYYGVNAPLMQMGASMGQVPLGQMGMGAVNMGMGVPMAQMPVGGQNGAMGAINAVGGSPNGVKNEAVTGAVNGVSVGSADSSNVGIKVNENLTPPDNGGIKDTVSTVDTDSTVESEEDASDDLLNFMSSI